MTRCRAFGGDRVEPGRDEIAEALDAERRNGTIRGPLHGIPFPLFLAGAYQEDKLLAIAYAYEQASLRRSAPAFRSVLSQARTGHELSALTTAG